MIKTHSASISNFINCFEQELHQCFKFEIIENENLILGEKKISETKKCGKNWLLQKQICLSKTLKMASTVSTGGIYHDFSYNFALSVIS